MKAILNRVYTFIAGLFRRDMDALVNRLVGLHDQLHAHVITKQQEQDFHGEAARLASEAKNKAISLRNSLKSALGLSL